MNPHVLVAKVILYLTRGINVFLNIFWRTLVIFVGDTDKPVLDFWSQPYSHLAEAYISHVP